MRPIATLIGILAFASLSHATHKAYPHKGPSLFHHVVAKCHRPAEHSHRRAGCPQCISKCAKPSNDCHYHGAYIGGGCACKCKSEPRYPEEGTWGWDYQCCSHLPHVWLGWTHGRAYQGGTGKYETDDGPKVPNVFECECPHKKKEK